MKKPIVIAVALCSVALLCTCKDTERGQGWRTVEPHLSNAPEWKECRRVTGRNQTVSTVQCEGDVVPQPVVCTMVARTHAEALFVIAYEQACIASAISVLREFAPGDPRAASDLAAAYYVRAQLENQPAYLPAAWQNAQDAVLRAPTLRAARYNLALIEEELGLSLLAERSWDNCQAIDRSRWGDEARRRRDRLHEERQNAASVQWPIKRGLLPAALATHDHSKVARLITNYPTPAEKYLEEDLLPQWAVSGSQKDLDAAQVLAEEVSRAQRDPFASDVVAAIQRSPDQAAVLKRGHLAFAQARSAERGFNRKDAIEPYARATRLFERGDSPLRYIANLSLIVNDYFRTNNPDSANAALRRIEQQIGGRYPHVQARIVATRAFILNDAGRHKEGLDDYDRAMQAFERLDDFDQVNAMHSAKAGVWQDLGNKEQAWREACETNHDASKVAEIRGRHVRLAALSPAALALEYPRLALLYQDEAVTFLREELTGEALKSVDASRGIKHHLSSALRFRAEIKLALGQNDGARQDLADAAPIAREEDSRERQQRNDLLARVEEVDGKSLLPSDPESAVKSFSAALKMLPKGQSPTLRTSLLSFRAKAYRGAGHPKEAKADLLDALEELSREEKIQLDSRQRGEGEDVWSPYFERFQETYRQLIDLYVEDKEETEAFAYAEKAKALEPLDLVRRLPFTPQRFLALTEGTQPVALPQLQAALPDDTFLLEYCVLEDKSFVWIVGHQFFMLVKLDARRPDVAAWRKEVHDAIQAHDETRLEHSLWAPYRGLLLQPLAVIPRTGALPRVVIIPDDEMQGLPFAALTSNPVTKRRLLQDAIVSVDGSATLYLFSLFRDSELHTESASALLIGDPKFDKKLPEAQGLGPLKWARKEVLAISTFYAPHYTPLTEADATAASFLRLARRNEVVHIAGHALVNEAHPSDSFLLFAPTLGDSGKLDVSTLARMQLEGTRLMVLASCSSAGGAPVGPEGVAPLIRPFVGAGVPGIVGSLWDVNDATAEPLLVSFHQRYRVNGEDAAKALRNAQLEALQKYPVLTWAPFEVIGYASAPASARGAATKEKPP